MNLVMLFKVLKTATFLQIDTAQRRAVNNKIGIVRSVTERTWSDPGWFIAVNFCSHPLSAPSPGSQHVLSAGWHGAAYFETSETQSLPFQNPGCLRAELGAAERAPCSSATARDDT